MTKLTFHKRGGLASPTLVLIHAFPFSSEMWAELIASISDLDISIATIDLPGFGQTPNSEWTMEGISLSLHDTFAAEGIDQPVLCGLSMGGYIALSYCRSFPGTVGGLILAHTKAAADPDEVKQDREKFAQDALKRGAIAATERNLAKMTSDWTKANAPEIAKQIEDWMLAADPQAIANALRAMAGRLDTMDLLPSIEVPVLLIVGEEDKVTPLSEMQKMAALMPNAMLVKITDASHMSVTEKPREFAAAVHSYLTALV